MLCSNAAKTPKFSTLSGHVEEVLLLKRLFPVVDACLRCEDVAGQSGAEMAIFCVLYLQRAACSAFQTCILNSHDAVVFQAGAVVRGRCEDAPTSKPSRRPRADPGVDRKPLLTN